MNWKLIGSAIGAVVVIGFVIYSLFGSGEDSAMSGRTGSRRNSSGASTPSPPPATSPKAAAPALAATGAPPAGAKPASPMPVAAAPVAVAPVNAAPIDPGIAAPAAPVAKPISLALVPPPARQRGAVSQSEPDRVRHTLLRLARIQMAIDDYSRANQGRYPAAMPGPDGKTPYLSWRVAILPYLGYGELYAKFHFHEPWNSPHNQQLAAEIPLYYQSPERGDEKTNYLGAAVLSQAPGMRRDDITDGLDHTLLLVEADEAAAVAWTEPRDLPAGVNLRTHLGHLRQSGFFGVWCSGLVSFIPERVSGGQLAGAFSPAQEDSDSYLLLSEPVGPKVAMRSAPAATSVGVDGPEGSAPVRPLPTTIASEGPKRVDGPVPQKEPVAGADAILPSLAAMTALSRAGVGSGQEPSAFQLAAAAAAIDAEPKGQAAKVLWSPGLKRPALGIRWGIGIELICPFPGVPTIQPTNRTRIAPKKMHGILAQCTGEVGMRIVEYLEQSASDGHFGAVIQEAASTATPIAAPNVHFAPRETVHVNEYFYPGLAFLGRGNSKQLMAWAQQDGIDVLLVFRVDCKAIARTGGAYSETSIAIHDVARGTQLFATPAAINSRKVEIDRATEREAQDPVVVFLEKPLEFIGQNLRMEPFPAALTNQPALVRSRVESLLASEPRDRLATLAEIRAYQVQGLIDAATFKAACQKLLDDDAADKLAANVPFDAKLQALQRWLPKLRAGTPVAREAVSDE